MLIDLTIDKEALEKAIKHTEELNKEHGLNMSAPYHSKKRLEKGVYVNLELIETLFEETKDFDHTYYYDLVLRGGTMPNYGVADNVEQIKKFFSKEVECKKNQYFIRVSPVFQNKANRGKGGGWRWHKNGKYIGELNPQYEHLDDEEFGEDFKYVLMFELYQVNDNRTVIEKLEDNFLALEPNAKNIFNEIVEGYNLTEKGFEIREKNVFSDWSKTDFEMFKTDVEFKFVQVARALGYRLSYEGKDEKDALATFEKI